MLHGNPYDGHTLREVIEDAEKLTGREIELLRFILVALLRTFAIQPALKSAF
jgi:hypothetical protein